MTEFHPTTAERYGDQQGNVNFDGVSDRSERKAPLVPVNAPTYGVSSGYRPKEYPKAVYFSFDRFEEAKNKEQEEALLARGGKLKHTDFEQQMVTVPEDEIAKLKKQLDVLTAGFQALVASQQSVSQPAPIEAAKSNPMVVKK